MDFILATDSTCDLPKDKLREMDIASRDMLYYVNDVEYGKDDDNQLEFHEFYQSMRDGARTSTSMINEDAAHEFLSGLLEQGKDILYLCFAKACSGTYDNFVKVANELNATAKNKIYVVDTKAESGAKGLS